MATQSPIATNAPQAPWGLLPSRLNVLYISSPRRTGAWLADAFACDSASDVRMEEAAGAAAGLTLLADRAFDAVLVSHDPPQLDALELLDGLQAAGSDNPLVVLGQASEQEMAALCYEAGADAYVCANTATTRMLLWIVARANERRQLLREHRRLSQAEQHRLRRERTETASLLAQQRMLSSDADAAATEAAEDDSREQVAASIARRAAELAAPIADPALEDHYRELLRAHVMMGSGNLADELAELTEALAAAGVSAPQAMQLHVQVVESLVRGLGNRSARHVIARADLLVLEMLVHLTERYRIAASVKVTAATSPSPAARVSSIPPSPTGRGSG